MSAIKALAARSEDRSSDAARYAKQAKRLGLEDADKKSEDSIAAEAFEAKFITAQDPVIETAEGSRLPAVPVQEAFRLNELKDKMENKDHAERPILQPNTREAKDGTIHGAQPRVSNASEAPGAPLRHAVPPAKTNPLFPPLPMYGPPSLLRSVQSWFFRFSSSILSLFFLGAIVLGSITTCLPSLARLILIKLKGGDPYATRPFFEEEQRRAEARKENEEIWAKLVRRKSNTASDKNGDQETENSTDSHEPLEGGPDPLVCDVRYYARRVGLEVEDFDVQTEDGFIIQLWHIYNPKEYNPAPSILRREKSPAVFRDGSVDDAPESGVTARQYTDGERRYPVLLIHGLLQSGGAYCCNDDTSLAFYLCKSGYDVWVGNNRCGFEPRHNLLKYGDPRMWNWNIRQMGVMDLPAFIGRVLEETGFEKLGLVCHSQGTTQTLVALAKEQRPEIGQMISVFCGLAPAAYAGPLIQKMYFRFMQIITPGMFRMLFGIHSFIPFMLEMHKILPPKFYGFMGYRVFSFLFDWSDTRWDRGLRDRMFQFSPVYVSSESMRWWLGRECFARQKCILSTRDEWKLEDEEDEEEDELHKDGANKDTPTSQLCHCNGHSHEDHGRYAWYGEGTPPFAFWVAEKDQLVDGKRLLRRFERGREPYVDVVHSKVIKGYEHLDVIWAIDVLDTVGKELKEVLWKTAPWDARDKCITPVGCENIAFWSPRSAQPSASSEVEKTADREGG